MTIEVGTLIDERYLILHELGSGGMGSVFCAFDSELQRQVALKIATNEVTDASKRAQLQKEGRILSDLRHENICKFYGLGQFSSGVPFMSMELLRGVTLRQKLDEQGPLPPLQCIDITIQICQALEAAHEHGIVHRDIKPSNIFLIDDSCVKVVDFGIARLLNKDQQATTTAAGTIVGSLFYMSPEQCLARKVDTRADIYSTGCLLYELCTGSMPFNCDNPVGLIHKHVNEDPPLIRVSRNSSTEDRRLTTGLNSIISKALMKSPDERYQTMSAFQSDLHLLKSDLLPVPPVRNRSTIKQRSTVVLTLLFALAPCVLFMVAFFNGRIFAPRVNAVPRVQPKGVQPKGLGIGAQIHALRSQELSAANLDAWRNLWQQLERSSDPHPQHIRDTATALNKILFDTGGDHAVLANLNKMEPVIKRTANVDLLGSFNLWKSLALLGTGNFEEARKIASSELKLLSFIWPETTDYASFSCVVLKATRELQQQPQLPDLQPLFAELIEHDCYYEYRELAPPFAYFYCRDAQSEERLYRSSLEFLRKSPSQAQIFPFVTSWAAELHDLGRDDLACKRLADCFNSAAPQPPGTILHVATMLCDYHHPINAKLALEVLIQRPDFHETDPLFKYSAYALLARTLLDLNEIKAAQVALAQAWTYSAVMDRNGMLLTAKACAASGLPKQAQQFIARFIETQGNKLSGEQIVELYNEVSLCLRRSLLPEGREYLMSFCHDLLEKQHDSYALAQLKVIEARDCEQHCRYEQALKLLSSALPELNSRKNQTLVATYITLANCYACTGHPDQCDQSLQTALALARSIGFGITTDSLASAAEISLNGNNLARVDYYLHELVEHDKLRTTSWLNSTSRASAVYMRAGKYDKSLAILQTVPKSLLSTQNPGDADLLHAQSVAYSQYGHTYLRLNQYQRAYEMFRQTHEIAQRNQRLCSLESLCEMMNCLDRIPGTDAKIEQHLNEGHQYIKSTRKIAPQSLVHFGMCEARFFRRTRNEKDELAALDRAVRLACDEKPPNAPLFLSEAEAMYRALGHVEQAEFCRGKKESLL